MEVKKLKKIKKKADLTEDEIEVCDWHTLKELPEGKILELREKLKIGSDIDGVICYSEVDKKKYRPFRLHEYHSLAIPSKYSGMHVDVFITGRRKCYWRTTLKWFKTNGIQCNVLVMFPPKIKKNKKTFDQYKSEVINLLELDEYFEDDERAVKSLRESCLNTEIIQVNDAKPIDNEPANQINEDSEPDDKSSGFKLKLDPELDNLFPHIPKEVYDSLKEDIKRDGILDDLKVDKDGFILDGMKRFKIAKEQDIPEKDIPYRVMYFENELDRMNFAIKHNIDRKSPDSYQRARAILLTEPLYKEEAKLRQGARTDLQPSEGGKFGETREIMSKIAGHGRLFHYGYQIAKHNPEILLFPANWEFNWHIPEDVIASAIKCMPSVKVALFSCTRRYAIASTRIKTKKIISRGWVEIDTLKNLRCKQNR